MWRGRILVCEGRRNWVWRDRILLCGGKNMPGRDRILLCGGEDTSGTDRILLCGGNVTLVCSSVHRMSVWSGRHGLWEYTGCRLEVRHGNRSCQAQDVRVVHKALPVGICRRSAWSQACPPMMDITGCPCGLKAVA